MAGIVPAAVLQILDQTSLLQPALPHVTAETPIPSVRRLPGLLVFNEVSKTQPLTGYLHVGNGGRGAPDQMLCGEGFKSKEKSSNPADSNRFVAGVSREGAGK